MKTIPLLAVCLLMALTSCGEKPGAVDQAPAVSNVDDIEIPLTPLQEKLVGVVTETADAAWIAKEHAGKYPNDPSNAVDYARAAAKADAAVAKAQDAQVNDLIIMGAEAKGRTKAMTWLEERAAENE
jgi:hypothetical protein